MYFKKFMRRFLVVSSLGILLIPLLVASAAWLPGGTIGQPKQPNSAGIIPGTTVADPSAVHRRLPSTVEHGKAQERLAGSKATLAQVQWRPFPSQIPGFGTVLASACLLLPFALSMWGTLRKHV
jgi:hypothetical protein